MRWDRVSVPIAVNGMEIVAQNRHAETSSPTC